MKTDDSAEQNPHQKTNGQSPDGGSPDEQHSEDDPPREVCRDGGPESEEFARLKERVRSGLYRPDMQALADRIMKDPQTIEMLLDE